MHSFMVFLRRKALNPFINLCFITFIYLFPECPQNTEALSKEAFYLWKGSSQWNVVHNYSMSGTKQAAVAGKLSSHRENKETIWPSICSFNDSHLVLWLLQLVLRPSSIGGNSKVILKLFQWNHHVNDKTFLWNSQVKLYFRDDFGARICMQIDDS